MLFSAWSLIIEASSGIMPGLSGMCLCSWFPITVSKEDVAASVLTILSSIFGLADTWLAMPGMFSN